MLSIFDMFNARVHPSPFNCLQAFSRAILSSSVSSLFSASLARSSGILPRSLHTILGAMEIVSRALSLARDRAKIDSVDNCKENAKRGYRDRREIYELLPCPSGRATLSFRECPAYSIMAAVDGVREKRSCRL